MLTIKVCDDEPTPIMDGVIANNHKEVRINEDSMDTLKNFLDDGREIKVKRNGEFVDANKLFAEDEEKDEEKEDEEDTAEIDFEELFDLQWKKRLKEIKKIDDVEKIEKILEYAKENSSENFVEKVEDYLNELKE